MTHLRPYQQDCVRAIVSDFYSGITCQGASGPCGMGKAVIAANLPEAVGNVAGESLLFIAHRHELIDQAARKFQQYNPGLVVEIERAGERACPDADVVVGSLQSLTAKRITKFDPDRFRIVCLDECHHSFKSQSYQEIMRYFGVHRSDPGLSRRKLMIGFSATWRRGDGKGAEHLFDKIVFHRSILDIMRAGIEVNGVWCPYLAPIRSDRQLTETNLDTVHVSKGDFTTGDLERAVNTPARNNAIVDSYLEKGEAMRAIAFTVDIQHSHDLAKAFSDRGIPFEPISGNTKPKDRDALFRDFESGTLRGMASCGVLCLDSQTEILTREGWKGKDEVTMDSLVANWHAGSIFWAKPEHIIIRAKRPGELMVTSKTQRRDIRVTGDHNMVFRYRGWKWQKRPAMEILGRKAIHLPCSGMCDPETIIIDQPTPPSDAKAKRRLISMASAIKIRKGITSEKAYAVARKVLSDHSELRYTQPHELTLDQCAFIGFWLGDGTRTPLQTGGMEYKVFQSLKYHNIVKWVDELLPRMGIDYIRRIKKRVTGKPISQKFDNVNWSLPRGTGYGSQARRGLFSIEPYLAKSGSELYWGLSEAQFDALLYGLWMADGNHGDGSVNKDSKVVYSVDKDFLDLLQSIAVTRGYLTSLRKSTRPKVIRHGSYQLLWKFWFRKQEDFGLTYGPLTVEENSPEEETVWCVTVPSRNIVTRRNGAVTVTGNSEGTDLPWAGVGINAKPTLSHTVYCQAFGRVTRPFPAPEERLAAWKEGRQIPWIKPYGIWLDFTDSSTKHNLIQAPTLFGLRPDFAFKGKDIEETVKIIAEAKLANPKLETGSLRSLDDLARTSVGFDGTAAPQEDVDLRKWSRYPWMKESEGQWALPVRGTNTVLRVKFEEEKSFGVWVYHLGAGNIRKRETTLRKSLEAAERLLDKKERKILQRDAPWRREPPTVPQCISLWHKDQELRKRFRNADLFFTYAHDQHAKGDMQWSKGAVADMLNVFLISNRFMGQRGSAKKTNWIQKAVAGVRSRFK